MNDQSYQYYQRIEKRAPSIIAKGVYPHHVMHNVP
jgi:hypothetical protein